MTFALEIPATPRTKKTHPNVVFKRVPTAKLPSGICSHCRRGSLPIVLPSDAFQAFEAAAVPHLRRQWKRPPLGQPVRVEAVFYREALRGDLVGYMQALADVLQAAGVVTDDKWIVGWGATRLDKSAVRPRVELVITVLDEGQAALEGIG